MFIRHKLLSLSLAATGALVWTGLGAGSAQAVVWTCSSTRSATWGSGQFCRGDNGTWMVRTRDDLTDGSCVEGKYFSEDSNSWRQTSPRSNECNGVWKSTVVGTQPYSSGVRLYRISDLRYLTLYP